MASDSSWLIDIIDAYGSAVEKLNHNSVCPNDTFWVVTADSVNNLRLLAERYGRKV